MSRYEEIEAFVRTMESGSFTSGAAQIGVAKSAISRRISDLEARLGAQLITRTTRKLSLTHAGENFLRYATSILETWHEAEATVRETQTALSGRLRIAAPLSFGIAHLGPALLDFIEEHPGISMEVDFSDSKIDLITNGMDMAVRIGELEDSSLMARKIAPIKTICAASPAYIEANGTPKTPEDLLPLNELAYTRRAKTGWAYKAPDGKRGQIDYTSTLRSSNGDFLRDAAIAGHGFVIEPSFLLYQDIKAGRLVQLLAAYDFSTLNAYAVYPQSRHVPLRLRTLIDFLRDRFGNTPYWDV